jgi:hypothetical protein
MVVNDELERIRGCDRGGMEGVSRRLFEPSWENHEKLYESRSVALPLRQPARIESILQTDHHVPSIHILSQMNPVHNFVPPFSFTKEYQNAERAAITECSQDRV